MTISLVFSFVLLYFINRQQIQAIAQGLVSRAKSKKIEDFKDEKTLDWIYRKTGIKLQKIIVYDMQSAWGLMAGGPFKPYLIVAKNALEQLTSQELEWLYLHEAGHFVLNHSSLLIFWQVLFGILTFCFPHLIIVFIIIYFQLARKNEYAANEFALKRMDHPNAVITLVEKAKQRWIKSNKPLKGWYQILFNIWTFDIYLDLAKDAKLKIYATD